MKLHNEQINEMAAELLGLCWHQVARKEVETDRPCAQCAIEGNRALVRADFIHDANASRRLVMWLRPRHRGMFNEFINGECLVWSLSGVLTLPPRTITLAVLYTAGKISLEQAKEAMNDD